MQISITIKDDELPERLEQVFKIVPRAVWCRRASDLSDRERQNPLLGVYFDERYVIERFLDRALRHWAQHGRLPSVSSEPEGGRYYDLYSFIHVLTSVYPRLSPKGQVRVRGYLRSGLQSEDGLAAFAHELSVAVHLWSMDFDVDFTDIEDRARFDILATKDDLRLEVDCKTHSADVGRQIHQRRAIELFHRVTPAFKIFAKPEIGRTVDVVLPGRLRGADSYMNAVASTIRDAIAQDKSLSVPQIADVSLGGFAIEDEPTLFTKAPTADALARIAERLGRTYRHVHWFGSPNEQAAVVAIVSSREPDQVVDYIYRQLKKSAERQFSGANPALVAANLLDLTSEQLRELASGPSELGNIANHLFAGPDREHLFGVAFVSPADMPTPVDIYGARLASRGMALLFRREGHPLAQDPRLSLFKPHGHPNGLAFLDHLPFWVARVGPIDPQARLGKPPIRRVE
jgi:hypothetical protein